MWIDGVMGDMPCRIHKDVSKRYHFFCLPLSLSHSLTFALLCLCFHFFLLILRLLLLLLLLHLLFILSFHCVCYLFGSTTYCVPVCLCVCWPSIKHALYHRITHIVLNWMFCYVICGVVCIYVVCDVWQCDCIELDSSQRMHTHIHSAQILYRTKRHCVCVSFSSSSNNLLLHLLKYWYTECERGIVYIVECFIFAEHYGCNHIWS